MLTIAHDARAHTVQHFWTAWNADPLVLSGILFAALLYMRGRNRSRLHRNHRSDWCFALGLLALGIALLSPLDELSHALASAHMVQHVVLVVVAAPLLAWSTPLATAVRGAPKPLRATAARWRKRLGLTRPHLDVLSHPVVALLLHTVLLWAWHSAVLYDAAVRDRRVHALEHVAFVGSALLLWRVVVAAPQTRRREHGERVLLLFAAAMQSVFLGVLLTFAEFSWYSSYRSTSQTWGLDPLSDQQLAGVIMWVPAGMVYVVAALVLIAAWLREVDHTTTTAAEGG